MIRIDGREPIPSTAALGGRDDKTTVTVTDAAIRVHVQANVLLSVGGGALRD